MTDNTPLDRDEQKALMKAAWREAHKEWLDEQMAKFGRWSAHTVFSAAMLALLYFILKMSGWHK
ncbi:MAG TPA: hypothetical protein VN017_05460 [Pseudoxanthomonas sp.]|nr:hypothetical protein [Pseudoxanthomonas sp.]